MKKFYQNIFFFTVLILIVNFLLLKIADDLYFRKYEKVDLSYNTYLMSDSHGHTLGNLTENFGIYNFSAGSESYFDIYRKVKFLINHSKIDKLLITVDDHTLSMYRESKNNLDRSAFFYELDLKNNFNESLKSLENKFVKRYFVLSNIKARDVIKLYFNSKLIKKNIVKKDWEDWSHKKQKESSINRFNFQFSYKKSNMLTSSLQEIINLCKNNNIELIGIKFPLTKEYISILGDNSFGADNIFESNNIRVINFKKIYLKNDEYFRDQDHLNRKGSIEFVKTLSNEF
mgnify:CR=1 FL=1